MARVLQPVRLLASLCVGTAVLQSPLYAADAGTITANTVSAAEKPLTVEEVKDPRAAAERFLSHINYARVALAMNNAPLAQEHLADAQGMLTILKHSTAEQRQIVRLESGQIVYDDRVEHKFHYFPIDMGPLEIRKVKTGPFWAKKGLAVTDAQIVYLTLNLNGNEAETRLAEAEASVRGGKTADAQKQLAALTNAVIKIDEQKAVPLDKARDNIALAYDFVSVENYDGARYALRHADSALDRLERDSAFADRRAAIGAMRSEVRTLQDVIKQNDPTVLNKAGGQLKRWWKDLSNWTKNRG